MTFLAEVWGPFSAFWLVVFTLAASGCATSPYELTDHQAAQISAALAKQVKP